MVNKSIVCMDSLKNRKRLHKLVEGFFKSMNYAGLNPGNPDEVKNWTIVEPNVPQQSDDVSCGVFVQYFIEMYLTNRPVRSFDVNSYRKRLKVFLLENFVPIDSLCSNCGTNVLDITTVITCSYCRRKMCANCADRLKDIKYESIEHFKCRLCDLNRMYLKYYEIYTNLGWD